MFMWTRDRVFRRTYYFEQDILRWNTLRYIGVLREGTRHGPACVEGTVDV